MSDQTTLRGRVARAEELGYSPVEARLTVLDGLAQRAHRELEHLWRTVPAGRMRELKASACQMFWLELRAVLWHRLEIGDQAGAVEVLDQALARVEPAGAQAVPGG